MELMAYGRVLVRWWFLIVIPVALGVGAVIYRERQAAPTSTSYSTVIRFSAAQTAREMTGERGELQDVWLASELSVKALITWVQTSTFKDQVAARLAEDGLTVNLNALGVASDHERSVGQIFLSYPDGADLAQIAAAALEVLQQDSAAYFPQLGETPSVTILDDIQITAAPPPIASRVEPILLMGVAGLGGLALAILAATLDRTLYNRDDVERLGLRVIASVPRD